MYKRQLIENAMLNMVRDILKKISKDGLPKNHHFLITFFSHSKGVIIPDWMKEKYPDILIIIFSNWFDNLNLTDWNYTSSGNLRIELDSLGEFVKSSVRWDISNLVETLTDTSDTNLVKTFLINYDTADSSLFSFYNQI